MTTIGARTAGAPRAWGTPGRCRGGRGRRFPPRRPGGRPGGTGDTPVGARYRAVARETFEVPEVRPIFHAVAVEGLSVPPDVGGEDVVGRRVGVDELVRHTFDVAVLGRDLLEVVPPQGQHDGGAPGYEVPFDVVGIDHRLDLGGAGRFSDNYLDTRFLLER